MGLNVFGERRGGRLESVGLILGPVLPATLSAGIPFAIHQILLLLVLLPSPFESRVNNNPSFIPHRVHLTVVSVHHFGDDTKMGLVHASYHL